MRFITLPAIAVAILLVSPAPVLAAASDSDPADPATLDLGPHPESVGYADPADLDALLGYRLPDWGWRSWTVDGSVQGSTSAYTHPSSSGHELAYWSDLRTAATWYGESEPRTWKLSTNLGGAWSRLRGNSDVWVRSLYGRFEVDARLDQYLLDDRWFVGLEGWAAGFYHETRFEHPNDTPDDLSIESGHSHVANVRAGWGRIRDVTPLVRAQRLAERLVALGHSRPAAAQIQAAARVLAQENGYRRVYARPDRRLWERILAPLTGGEPLSVAEVFYLREAMVEDLGPRRQGSQVVGVVRWRQDGLGEGVRTQPGLGLQVETWRNLSLTLQLAAGAAANWSWNNVDDPASDTRTLEAETWVDLLWNVADRIRLDGSVWADLREMDLERRSDDQVNRRVGATVEARFYVEDRMFLRPEVNLTWRESESGDYYWCYREWSYALTFGYDLDGVIF